MFLLSADGTVLHCLPGYWSPQDLLSEIRFVLDINRIWQDPELSLETKRRLFKEANLRQLRQHSPEMRARSHLQSFDARHEKRKTHSDFRYKPGDFRPSDPAVKYPNLKPTDQVVHERMARRPFVPYEKFDVEKFSDYGRMKYDKREESREGVIRVLLKK
jgi:hypothetical protein